MSLCAGSPAVQPLPFILRHSAINFKGRDRQAWLQTVQLKITAIPI